VVGGEASDENGSYIRPALLLEIWAGFAYWDGLKGLSALMID
jgi:hypothetical protein